MRRVFLFACALILAFTGSLVAARAFAVSGATRAPGVLLVCNGSTAPCPAQPPSSGPYYTTVQAAVDAAQPGDWILIYPGVYHEKSTQYPDAGVWIDKPDLHLRGLNRNQVIIDGSNGTAAHPCPSAASQQDRTPRNGIEVWKASGVTIQNLTVCDYLAGGNEDFGNEIWWNGGDGTAAIGMGSYSGSYLTATSMYAATGINSPQLAQYGIFVSNASGPGQVTDSYASNMADSAYYVGACRQECNTTLSGDTGVNSELGYSGTNSGGRLVITDSVFELNHAGIVPNSENNDDAPPPQDGRCPGSDVSCTVIEHNLIDDNNNPNTPTNEMEAPIGTGVQLAGGEFDTVAGNTIENQGGWGVLVTDFPDSEKPPAVAHCQGGVPNNPLPGTCLFEAHGNLVFGNTFSHVGTFGNLGNADLASETLYQYTPRNCFYGNTAPGAALTSAPGDIESPQVDGQPCTGKGTGIDLALAAQLACATAGQVCVLPSFLAKYPKQTATVMVPLPALASMPDPCAGVPENAFCA